MAVIRLDVGDCRRVTFTFRDLSSAVIDPTAVTFEVSAPGAGRTRTTTTYTYALGEVTKSSTGVYYKDITFNYPGQWWIRGAGTGAAIAAEEQAFEVRERRVPA